LIPAKSDRKKQMTKRIPTRLTGQEDEATLRAIAARLDQEEQNSRAKYELSERAIALDLRKAGVKVSSVWDLVNSAQSYPTAIPVLIDHLQRPYPERVLEGVARALAVKEARPFWPILRRTYLKWKDLSGLGAKGGLACALAATAHDGVSEELLSLLRDPKQGESRLLLLLGLAKLRAVPVEEVLTELEKDPVLTRQVQAMLRRRRSRRLKQRAKRR
jgi:hypothetical protein